MNVLPNDPQSQLRRAIYWILIAISAGSITGRILAVNSVDRVALEKRLERPLTRPFLSSNDRSRWATMRSLVEHGTYQIDDIVRQPNWDTVDMVKHDDLGHEAPVADQGHMYSSKPPLLATLMAGPYWIIYQTTGATLGTHTYTIGRGLIILFNVIPLIFYFWLLARMAERLGISDWGRVFVVAAGAFATFLSTFAVAVNNHQPAAISALISVYCLARVWVDGERRWRYFVLAGLFGAFTVTNELPALSLFGLLSLTMLWLAPRQTLLAYTPAALIVAAGFFGTNWIAHNTLTMPYAHRSDGDNWYDFEFLNGDGQVRQSYWSEANTRSPVDQGEPRRDLYVFHALIGHHGIFSLTPIWLLTIVGLGIWLARGPGPQRGLAAFISILSLVCITFYLTRPQNDRNYGGMTSGFRWVFWFTPLWLIGMLPAVDAAATRRWARGLAYVLAFFSAMSVSYPTWNPWTHPWMLDFLLSYEWAGLGER